jgi:DNA-binding HxlR family transcriptional regulator
MALLDLLGRRWTLRVLWELREGPVKFRDLAARADAMSQSVLSRRLKELEAARFVLGAADGWQLSRDGGKLLQLLLPLSQFSNRWASALAERKAGVVSKAGHGQVKPPGAKRRKDPRRRSVGQGR